jgi:hypothetical protein
MENGGPHQERKIEKGLNKVRIAEHRADASGSHSGTVGQRIGKPWTSEADRVAAFPASTPSEASRRLRWQFDERRFTFGRIRSRRQFGFSHRPLFF